MAIKYFWNDFRVGEKITLGSKLFTEDDIIVFAKKYDPQFFHTDQNLALQSNYGTLIASGWQTCSEMMRIICDSYLLETASLGSPGIENLRWIKPVRPGDNITLTREITSKRLSKSNPQIGIVNILFEAENQKKERVLSMQVCQMVSPKKE